MTLLAGAFAYGLGAAMPEGNLNHVRRFFRSLAERHGAVHQHEEARFAMFHWDSGACTDSAWISDPGGVCALAGDPLLESHGRQQPRRSQLQQLRRGDGAFDPNALERTRGCFAAVSFDSHDNILRIVTDQLGVRPVYCAAQDGVFYFSSALHLLESLPQLNRTLDRRGLLEYLAFGFSLADRTPYRNISLLPQATLLQIDANGVQSSSYFDWTAVQVDRADVGEASEHLFSTFADAVRLRLDGSTHASAFLSGGMDSRAIVAALAAQGCQVRAFNFSPDHSQDQAFAVGYAKSLGEQCNLSLHHRPNGPNFSMLAASAMQSQKRTSARGSERQIWSGDGGSVCLGYVYLDETMLGLAEDRAWASASRTFLDTNRFYVAPPLLAPAWRVCANQELEDSVAEAMQENDNGDPGRNLYFFLLFNDQRRHLHKHFESIHAHGLEFHLPFLDVRFIKEVIRTPAVWGLRHRLYCRWFDHFQAPTRSTPWQTYPGHEPCPLQADEMLSYQWSQAARHGSRPAWSQRCSESAALLQLALHPADTHLIDRTAAGKAAVAHLLGLRNLQHLGASARRWTALRPSRTA